MVILAFVFLLFPFSISIGSISIGSISIELNPALKQIVPSGYELSGLEDVQNEMFSLNSNVYHYRQSKTKGYKVVDYGKPYQILLTPRLSNMKHNSSLFMVFTQPKDHSLRQLFRRVISPYCGYYNISYLFVLTRDSNYSMSSLRKEYSVSRDLLVFNHSNTYRNLLLNVMYSYHYLSSLELSYRYYIKVDIDIAVNIKKLMEILYSINVDENELYVGDCLMGHYSTNKKNVKHFVPKEIYIVNNMVSFARGGLYVLSKQTMLKLLIGIRHLDHITHQEDMVSGRALTLMNVTCINGDKKYWLARHGCNEGEDCRQYVSIHPELSKNEIYGYYKQFQITSVSTDHIFLSQVEILETHTFNIYFFINAFISLILSFTFMIQYCRQ